MSTDDDLPNLGDLRVAADRIRPFVHSTPVLTSRTFDKLSGGALFFKCENLQRVGAFKIRGATNAVRALEEPIAARGVATHSSGNHAQALALAAATRGIKAYVVMPNNAPRVKVDAVRGYGAEITFCEPTLAAREETLDRIISTTGAVPIHPFDNPLVIAGQGTVALELLEAVPDLDAVVAPVGGGGLLSGISIAVRAVAPGCQVIGVEPELAADAQRSLELGVRQGPFPPRSIADGLLTSLSERTFRAIKANVDRIVTVAEEEIVEAMRVLWERMKIVVEPSGAVPFAAVLAKKLEVRGKRVGMILSGGNVDLNLLPWAAVPLDPAA